MLQSEQRVPGSEQQAPGRRSSISSTAIGTDTGSMNGRTAIMLGPDGTTLRELLQLVKNTVQTVKEVQSFRRLDKHTKENIGKLLQRAETRAWCNAHGKHMTPPRLHPAIRDTVREWFELVDDDGSGTLEHHELMEALQAAQIPCDASSITEMINLMDRSKRGCIGWHDFECFMMAEFASGKSLLSGEYMLPSGMVLPFGAMIAQLRRNRIMHEVMEGGDDRNKWLWVKDFAGQQEEVARAEQAIKDEKQFALSPHLRHKESALQLDLRKAADDAGGADSAQLSCRGSTTPSSARGSTAQGRRASGGGIPSLTPEAQQLLAARRSGLVVEGGIISALAASLPRSSTGGDAGGRPESSSNRGGSGQGKVPSLNLAAMPGHGLAVTPLGGSRLCHTARVDDSERPRTGGMQQVQQFWSPVITPRLQHSPQRREQQQQQQQQEEQAHGIAARLHRLRSPSPAALARAASTAAQEQQQEADAAAAACHSPRPNSKSVLERLPQALRELPHASPASPRRQSAPGLWHSPRSAAGQVSPRRAGSPPSQPGAMAGGAEAAEGPGDWQAKASSMLAREYRLQLMSPRSESGLKERVPQKPQSAPNALPILRAASAGRTGTLLEQGGVERPKEDAEMRQLLLALGSARVVPPALLLSGSLKKRAAAAAAPQQQRASSAGALRARSPAVASRRCPRKSSSSSAVPQRALVATNHGPVSASRPRGQRSASAQRVGAANSAVRRVSGHAASSADGRASAASRGTSRGVAGGSSSKHGKDPCLGYAATLGASPR